MGNLVQCGDVCKSKAQNQWERPPNKDTNSQHGFIQDDQTSHNPMFKINNPNQSIRKTKFGELIDQQRPIIETKIEQNHMIVPISLVRQRVNKKLSHALGDNMAVSSFNNDSKWYLLPSGNYYCGELKDGEPVGIGTFLLPKMIYFGSVRNQKPEGEGSILGEQFEFKGIFVRGRATGHGQIIFSSCYLKGEFKKGKIERGKLTCLDYEYQGEFLNGQPDGYGQYHNHNHTACFIGRFEKGRPQGESVRKCIKNQTTEAEQTSKNKVNNKKKQTLKKSKKTPTC